MDSNKDFPAIPKGPVTSVEAADQVTARRLVIMTEKKLDLCPLCKNRHFFKKTWSKVSPPYANQMLSTHLASCPKFAEMSPAQREKTVLDHNCCLRCSSWDHKKHKLPGGTIAGEVKCQHQTDAGNCGGKHGPWYHSTPGGAATTGSIVAACGMDHEQASTRKPGLYEIYSVAIPDLRGGVQTGTILIDPGSDTNYIRHDYTQRLGLQGAPYSCYLKVVDTEYVRKETARYEFDVVDKDRVPHHISALGL